MLRVVVDFERLWPLSTVVMALVNVGLTLEHLGKHADRYWDPFPHLPPEDLRRIPQTFSLLARRR